MRRTALLAFVLLLPLAACARPARDLAFLGTDPAGRRPYSDAVRAGGLLFVSGKLGTDSTGQLVPGGIGPETRAALENVRASILRHGGSMDRVAKCTVFLADVAEWGAMNEVYVTFFPTNRPARSALGTNGLVNGARVEIECIAAL